MFNNYDFPQVSSAQWGRYSDETPEENSGLIPSSTADNTKVWIDFSNVSLNVGDIVYTTGGYWKFALGTNNANTSYSGSNWIEGGFMPDHYHVMTAEDVLDAKILYFKRTDNEEITPSQFKEIRNNFSIRRA